MVANMQRYVSKELTHFVGKSLKSDEDRYNLLVKIIRNGWLTYPPHIEDTHHTVKVDLISRISDNEMYNPEIICFCDIHLLRIVPKYQG